MCKVIAIANQKGGVGKTTTTVNLGIGLVRAGKKVLLIDADSQGSLTASLGFAEPDSLEVTLATNLAKIMNEEEFNPTDSILYHEEDVDIVPCNIELSGLEVSMVNAMRREYILKEYVDSLKDQYDAMKHQGVQGNSLSTMSKETGENAKKIQRYHGVLVANVFDPTTITLDPDNGVTAIKLLTKACWSTVGISILLVYSLFKCEGITK